MLILFNKPHQVLSQFNENPDYPNHRTLSTFGLPATFSPIGRLDYDSEGLLLLSDDPRKESELMHPTRKVPKTYLTQVDGSPTADEVSTLSKGGLEIRVGKKIHICLPADCQEIPPPSWIKPRTPEIDPHASLRSAWLQLTLKEGKNRQVRKMTAKVGLPTLRLIRTKIGHYDLGQIASSEWIIME